MVQSTRSRTLFYRRVHWTKKQTASLESLLTSAHEKCETTKKRRFLYGDGEIVGLRCSVKEGVLLHIAYYIPKQLASIVPSPSGKSESDTATQPAPQNFDFMEGDIFLYAKGNHLLLCPSGVRENVAISYLKYMVRKVESEDLSNNFEMHSVADMDKVRLIRDEGVRKIQLSESMYDATFDQMARQTIKTTLIKNVAKEIMSLVSKESSPNENPENFENLMIKLEISYDSRKKGGDISKGRIEQLGRRLASEQDNEGVQIITGSGKNIRADEVRLSKHVDLAVKGRSVQCSDAWAQLKDYYAELKRDGMLSR